MSYEIAFSTGCFLERHEKFIIPKKIDETLLEKYGIEVQIDRGFKIEEFARRKIVAVHLPFKYYFPCNGKYSEGRMINIASINKQHAKEDFFYLLRCIRKAVEHNITQLILHQGTCCCPASKVNKKHIEEHIKNEKDFLTKLFAEIDSSIVNILIENEPYPERLYPTHLSHLTELKKEFPIKICFDTVHANYVHMAYSEPHPTHVFSQLKDICEIQVTTPYHIFT